MLISVVILQNICDEISNVYTLHICIHKYICLYAHVGSYYLSLYIFILMHQFRKSFSLSILAEADCYVIFTMAKVVLNSRKLYLQRNPRTFHLFQRLTLVKLIFFLPLSYSGVSFSVFKETFLSWTLFKMNFKLIAILTVWHRQFSKTVTLSHPKSSLCMVFFYVTLKNYLFCGVYIGCLLLYFQQQWHRHC